MLIDIRSLHDLICRWTDGPMLDLYEIVKRSHMEKASYLAPLHGARYQQLPIVGILGFKTVLNIFISCIWHATWHRWPIGSTLDHEAETVGRFQIGFRPDARGSAPFHGADC